VRTRQAILDAAGVEFSIGGYSGSGLGSIVSRAELTKGALFHHFPDKQALAKAWIADALAPAMEKLWIAPMDVLGSLDAFRSFCRARCMELRPGDPAPAMEKLWIAPMDVLGSLDAFRSFCRARCMELRPGDPASALVSLTAETAAAYPELGVALEVVFSAWRASIATWLERGKAAGWIHRSIQPAVEASFIISVFSGFTVTTQCRSDDSMHRTCASALDAYLETLRAQ